MVESTSDLNFNPDFPSCVMSLKVSSHLSSEDNNSTLIVGPQGDCVTFK